MWLKMTSSFLVNHRFKALFQLLWFRIRSPLAQSSLVVVVQDISNEGTNHFRLEVNEKKIVGQGLVAHGFLKQVSGEMRW